MHNVLLWSVFLFFSVHGSESWYEEVVPGTGKTVKLPFPYLVLEESDKNMPYLDEGCCTVLTQVGQKVLVGPIGPQQLIVLHNNGKTIVGVKDECASLNSLLVIVCQEIDPSALSKTKGLIFTNKLPFYDTKSEESETSLRDGYQGRAQAEEISYVAKRLIEGLCISDKDHITKHTFNINKYNGDPSAFFIVVEHRGNDAECFNTCPATECLFGLSSNMPTDERLIVCKKNIHEIRSKNPYLIPILAKKLTREEWKASYEAFNFVRV